MKKRILKALLFKKPIHLILHVTNICNLRCKTCFVDFERAGNDKLSLEEIREVAVDVGKLIWLDISGGEPFLRNDIADICSNFDAESIAIPTNGHIPQLIFDQTKIIRSKTRANLRIDVSIDGFEKTNDDIRGSSSFKNAIDTVRLLKSIKGIRIKINTVLCNRNYDEIIDFMRFIRDLDVDFHSIIFRRGAQEVDIPYDRPSYEKLLKLKKDVFEIWRAYDYGVGKFERKVLQNYQKIMYETSLRIIKEKRQIPDCLAGTFHLVIGYNGDVAFCEMLPPFGNIRYKKLKELLSLKEADRQRKSIRAKRCYCHHNCNLMDSILLNPFFYPKLLSGI